VEQAATSPLRIVVTGLIGSIPLPGLTYHYLQYALGLHLLGHDVHYLEDTGTWNYSPQTDTMVAEAAPGVRHLAAVMRDAGLERRWTFRNHDGEAFGVAGRALDEVLGRADLFLNVTGANLLGPACSRIPLRVYLDTDPGFVQMRAAQGSRQDREHLDRHNRFASFGANIGDADCRIPALGRAWFATRQPVVRALWPEGDAAPSRGFVTIMKWRSYQPETFEGERFGLKDVELERFVHLPGRVGCAMELAVLGDGPRARFERAGWTWSDAAPLNRSLDAYRAFLGSARGEWSVAKNGYVRSRSGWFGDRSASMLAMGRPVVVQSTGFERRLPTGEGVLSFSTPDGAAEALRDVGARYALHAARAREIAAEHFDHRRVLTELLAWACGGSPPERRGAE
jgi:hypothetical protein